MKILVLILTISVFSLAHPVAYKINLSVSYDEGKKEVQVNCKSDSRNKCGLHNFHLLDKDEKIIQTTRFPFLKNKTVVKGVDEKPYKMVFFLRKIPAHTYNVLFQ